MSGDPTPAHSPANPPPAGAPPGAGQREDLTRSRLKRNRILATGMLGAMGAIFVGTHMVEEAGFSIQLIRAGAEAGVVGGLADWFAITALFRRPLGLPIPHTAIIPSNKDRIGRTIGRFVERNFLTEEAILRKVREAHPTQRIAETLSKPDVATAMAGSVIAAMPYAIRSLENRDLHEFVNRTLGEQLRDADFAAVLGRAIRVFSASGEADVLFERATGITFKWIGENRGRIEQVVQERSRWWVPKTINRRIAGAIINGVTDVLKELREEESDARLQFRQAVSGLVDELLTSPEQREKINEAKNRLLEHPDVQAWLAAVWTDLSQATLHDLAQPNSKTRTGIEKALLAVGHAVGSDPMMQKHIDSAIERAARHLVSWRSEIGGFISDVVRGWDARALSDRLELVVGSDLQYIRMNGTVVGAIVGCLLFLSVRLFS